MFIEGKVIRRVNRKGIEEIHYISPLEGLVGFVAWITGFFVALAVGFGMIDGTLRIPVFSELMDGIIVMTAGWIVVILALLGVFLKIIDKFGN